MDQPLSLIELFSGREDAWVPIKGEKAVEGRFTYKGGYVQHFEWATVDGRQIKNPSGKEIIDVEGYFETSDERAVGLFVNEKRPWGIELPFFGQIVADLVYLRRTKKSGVYAVRSAF